MLQGISDTSPWIPERRQQGAEPSASQQLLHSIHEKGHLLFDVTEMVQSFVPQHDLAYLGR